MRTVFADSYYFVALLSKRDQGHARASAFAHSSKDKLVTTAFVLIEVGNSPSHSKANFLSLLTDLRSDPMITIIEGSHELFQRGVELFASRTDKEWSLTDCTSFVVTEEQGLSEALTADRHFEQAGFIALLA
jgi:predicted nucleic acid-binding protein